MKRQRTSAIEPSMVERTLHVCALIILLAITIGGVAFTYRHHASVEAQEAIEPWPRPVFIVGGDCAAPVEVAWPLNVLTSPNGDLAGSADADRTEYSFTSNVPLTIGALLEGAYAIQVQESAQKPESTIACGNVGGVPDSVGTLVVGLRWQDGLDVTGIAVLSPSPSDVTRTLISVFISGSALGKETGTWSDPVPEDPTAVPVEDTPVPPPPVPTETPLLPVPTDTVAPPESTDVPTEEPTFEPTAEPTFEPTKDYDGGHDDDGGHDGDDDGRWGDDDQDRDDGGERRDRYDDYDRRRDGR